MAANNNRNKRNSGSPDRTFQVKDCALMAIATGIQAQNARELRDVLQTVDPASIYYHFWGGMLRPKFDDPEYANDFAAWARHGLHDDTLAERLGVIDPTEFADLEALRQELVEVVEARLDEIEHVPWAKGDERFNFIRSRLVVFDSQRRIAQPEELPEHMPLLSQGSIFYHFVDARRRTPDRDDDLSWWLTGWGDTHAALRSRLAAVDYYFVSLSGLRHELSALVRDHFNPAGAA